jgi:AAHS family 4-hydroxybenzoate transporter-like MFS transporter
MSDVATPGVVHVDDLIDRQSLGLRGYAMIALLLLALVCDGFDLQIVGVAAPWLADAWHLKPSQLVGPVQTANLLGMMIGAIFLGGFGDRLGRKRLIVSGTLLYGVATLLALKTASVTELGLVRFITGLGLGGVLPNVIALAAEMSPKPRRAMLTSVVIIGMSLGSGMPGVVAAQLAPAYGWESLFVVGGVVPLVIAALLALFLPESLLFLTSRGTRRAEVERRVRALDPAAVIGPDTRFALRERAATGKGSFGELFSPGLRIMTPLLWVMFAGVLLSMHFLNSWISTVLKLGNLSPTQFSLTNSVFHWGGTIAAVATALVLGRLGLRWVLILLLTGMVSLLTIATQGFASAWLLTFAVCFAGFGVIGCQGALNASAGMLYPSSCRTTGVGAALGFGRIGSLAGPLIGGYITELGVPMQRMFYVPLVPLALAVLATIVLLMRHVDIRSDGSAH